MLGHRLRRWPNIEPTSCQCIVFVGMVVTLTPRPVLQTRHCFFIAGNKMIDPHVILAMPFNFILRSSHLYYRNTQFLLWQCHLT